jgi:catechol 2,3-dioxygenase-like lactoylglutathione lyase family enzyme
MTIQIDSLLRVILYVRDMNRMVRFYRDSLGLQLLTPRGLEDFGSAMWVEFDTGACPLALHGGGEGRTGPTPPELVFRVSDAAVARQALVDAGLEMGPVRELETGNYLCSGRDPEGHPFSLESRKD